MQAQIDVVRANGHEACYIRPIAFYGSEKMGVSPGGRQGARRDRRLALGRLPRAGGAREGHPREDLVVRAPPRQRDDGARQDVGHLPQLGAGDAGGDAARLRRGAAARRRRLRRRGRGREHLHRQGRRDLRAGAHLGAHRHHARLGDRARRGPRLPGRVAAPDARRHLHRRRVLLHRHRRRGDADPRARRPRRSARARRARSPRSCRRRSSTWSPARTASTSTG